MFAARIVLLCFIVCSGMAGAAKAESAITLPVGSHTVALRVVQHYELTRSGRRLDPVTGELVGTERARPVQTLIWHASASGAPLQYTDYRATRLTESKFDLAVVRREPKQSPGVISDFEKSGPAVAVEVETQIKAKLRTRDARSRLRHCRIKTIGRRQSIL